MPRTSPAVKEFLDALPADRRREVTRVRSLIQRNLPKGYEEAVRGNTLVYQVPLARYPDTYNKQPMWYVGLASVKSGMSLHLLRIYFDKTEAQRLADGFRAAGKRLDMGKGCIRFRTTDDLPTDAIGRCIAGMPMDRWIEIAKAARRR